MTTHYDLSDTGEIALAIVAGNAPAEPHPITGWTYSAAAGIAEARSIAAFNEAAAAGLAVQEANAVAHYTFNRNLSNRGFCPYAA